MFCPKCGTDLPEDAAFCAKCGARLEAAASAPTAAAPAGAGRPAGAAASASPAAPAGGAAAAKSRKPLIAALAAAVAVVAVAAAAAWFLFLSPYRIDEATFPDAAVRAAVAQQADADHNGELSRDEARAVTALSVQGAADVSGLGKVLPNIQALEASGDALSAVDVTDLGALTTLSVSGPALSSVNASGAGSLEALAVDAQGGSPSIDVSGAGSLSSLTVSSEGGSPSVDVSGAGSLSALDVPEGAQVSGFEDAGLQEAWLPVRVSKVASGNETWRTEIERDASGRVSAIREGSVSKGTFGGKGQTLISCEYSYGDDGLLSGYARSVGRQGSGGDPVSYQVVRDDAGKVTSIKSPHDEEKCTYDDAGNLEGRAGLAYDRDEAGNVTACRNLATGGKGTTTYSWSYDSQGRLAGFVVPYGTGAGDLKSSGTVSYDDAGRPVSVKVQVKKSVETCDVTYSYDDQGRLSGAKAVDGATDSPIESKRTSEVSYDEYGNVASIVTTIESGGGPDRTTGYEIKYQRFFLPEDAQLPADVVVSPDYGTLWDDPIQVYVLRPHIVRASDTLPVSLDDQYLMQNLHLSV